jgi:hypothetical protein
MKNAKTPPWSEELELGTWNQRLRTEEQVHISRPKLVRRSVLVCQVAKSTLSFPDWDFRFDLDEKSNCFGHNLARSLARVMSHTTTTMLAFALACVAFTAAAPARDRRQGHRGRPFSENDLPTGSHLRRELARCGSRGVSVCQSFPTVFPQTNKRGLVAFARACVARVFVPCGLKRPMTCV